MAKKSHAPKAGRPITIDATVTAIVRISKAMSEAVDNWAAASNVSRSEAIRRLVELGLKVKKRRDEEGGG